MDYSSELCMNSFTHDQVALMRSMVETVRNGLLWENNPTDVENPMKTLAQIKLYPNPTTDAFHLTIDLKKEQDLSLHILNIMGKEVMLSLLVAVDRCIKPCPWRASRQEFMSFI